MPVSDDQKLAMWREVLQLCRVKPGQNVAVLTGETSLPQNIDMAVRASAALGARVCRIEVPPGDAGGAFGQRADVGITPLTGHRLVVDMLKKADMVLDLMGLLHSPEQLEILAAGTRILLVVEPPDMLARMIPSPDDKRRVQAAQKRLKTAKTMTVTSKAGTDLTMPLGQFPTLAQWGYSDEPGHWDHWPSGFVATWPNEGASAGRLVIDSGDILLPFKFYVQSKIELDIRDGMITRIDGGFDAKYLRKHLESPTTTRPPSASPMSAGDCIQRRPGARSACATRCNPTAWTPARSPAIFCSRPGRMPRPAARTIRRVTSMSRWLIARCRSTASR